MIHYKKDVLCIDDVALRRVAAKYGTPLYCYSASMIENNYWALQSALHKIAPPERFTIAFACKANSNIAVLRLLRNLGAGADIVSGGEMKRALKAGISPAKIVFSGVGKTEKELTEAIKNDLFQINVESEEELELIAKIARRLKKTAAVAIRVNPDIDARTHANITTGKKENKFGIDFRKAPALYARAKKMKGIEAAGVSIHIGSQLTSTEPFRRAFTRIADLVRVLRKQGNAISRVDLGGGLGISYKKEKTIPFSAYAKLIREIILPLDVHVILEPGRAIVGDAGLLLSQVIRIKDGGSKKFLIIDAAMNDLMRPALYDAYHAVLPCVKTPGKATYDIVGPVCETGDCFLRSEKMPKMKEGDLVAIMDSGAYGAVMASTYNTRPLIAEAMVGGDLFSLVRKRQPIEQMILAEAVPYWL